MTSWSFRALAGCCLFLTLRLARAEPMSLEQAVEQAVQSHPRIVAARRRWEAGRVRARFAGAIVNPTIQIGDSIGDPSEETIMFRQGFELAGQPGLRAQLALQELRALEFELASAQRELAIEVGRAYLDYWQAEQRLAVFRQRQDLFGQFEYIARRRFEVGDIAENQFARVALERQRAEADLAGAQAQLAQAEARLRTTLGLAAPVTLLTPSQPVPEAPLVQTTPPDLERLRQSVGNVSEVGRAEANYEAARLQTELARKQGSPELALQLYRSNLFRNNLEQGVQLTFSWTPWDYGQIAAEVATREGEQLAREAEVEAARRSVAQRLEAVYQAWVGAQRRRNLLRSQVLESLRLARVAQKAFDAGYWTLQETLDAQRTYREAQLEYLSAESEYAQTLLELTWLARPPQAEENTR